MRVDATSVTTVTAGFIKQIRAENNGQMLDTLGVHIDNKLNPTLVSLFLKSNLLHPTYFTFYPCIMRYSYTSSTVNS